MLNGRPYSVGDNIAKLKGQFPKSYKNRSKKTIDFNVSHNGKFTDAFIFFEYNAKGIITHIEMSNNNS